MPPSRQREASIERTPEYEEFMQKLVEYHQKRGTHLDREPKVGSRHLDLLRLYKRVCEEGGYDAVSDKKAKPLAWRRISGEFLPGSTQLQAQAFIVKTAYYKNLAAFEISNFHKREPPPREILEDVSAKGGDLLKRTVDNYFRRANREELNLLSSKESDNSDADADRTPKEEKMDVDEAAGTGRATRGLRQQPPQRVLFQPDLTPARQSRQTATHANSPTPASVTSHPAVNGVQTNGVSMTIANYEPRQQIPSNVKPAITPANTPEYFKARRMKLPTRTSQVVRQSGGMMLPGTGFIGPNIYIRALLALQSGIAEEEEYALHHLVKISHERGDKYRFDGFPGLAEALVAKLIEVSSLFYDVRWKLSFEDEEPSEIDVLDGLNGTRDLLEKLQSLTPLDGYAELHPEDLSRALGRINEAGLALRNLALLEENALYLCRLPLVRDFITIALHLPKYPTVIELKHYALEIAEQVTRHISLDSQDPLYISLASQLDSTDRGAVITAMRALSRISMNLEVSNRLRDVPIPTLERICRWLLVEDEELRNACLDFLYQFTAVTENVETLIRHMHMEGLVDHLVRLLMYKAMPEEKKERSRAAQRAALAPTAPPTLSADILDLLNQHDEPERSSQWLRTCFEEDPQGEVTQIAIWQAYQNTFLESTPARHMLSAKDFITNVSTTFPGATAQVDSGPTPKYTIRGIQPRAVPVDARGRPYTRCLWQLPETTAECGVHAQSRVAMWEHVVSKHMGLERNVETGKFEHGNTSEEAQRYDCRWAGCGRFEPSGGNASAYAVAMHLKTHLPNDDVAGSAVPKVKRSNQASIQKENGVAEGNRMSEQRTFWNTQTDERHDAAGLPLASILVLRNLARQLPKVESLGGGTAGGRQPAEGEEVGLVQKVFGPVKGQIFSVMAYNLSLREYLVSLMGVITAGGG